MAKKRMAGHMVLAAVIALLGVSAGCTSALTQGDSVSDGSHSFRLLLAQVIDKIDGESPPQDMAFLVLRYRVENLTSTDDAPRQWNDLLTLEAGDEHYQPTSVEALEAQMWRTALPAGGAETGRIAFQVPDDVVDFRLTVTFPVSGAEEVYEFRPVDKRISVNADFVLTRLEQIERTRNIPVIGGLLASLSSAPIRYLGLVLVPEEEIEGLLEQTRGLPQAARRAVVEDYLLEHGHGRLE